MYFVLLLMEKEVQKDSIHVYGNVKKYPECFTFLTNHRAAT